MAGGDEVRREEEAAEAGAEDEEGGAVGGWGGRGGGGGGSGAVGGGGTVAGRCAVGGPWIAREVREPGGLRERDELRDAVGAEPFVALGRVFGAEGGVGGGDAWVEGGHGGWHRAED